MQLFVADNFSNPEIKYKHYDGEIDNFSVILDNYFDDYLIIDVWQLDRPEINSENYKLIIKLAGQERQFLLRRHHALNQLEQIEFYLDLVSKMGDNSVKVSRVIKNKNNLSGTLNKDFFYSLFEFIDATYFSPNEETLVSVAESIAKLHQAFNTLPQHYNSKIISLSSRIKVYFNAVKDYNIHDFVSILKIISSRHNLTDADKIVLEKLPDILKIVEQIKLKAQKINNLPKQIIHSDLHPHNILIKDKQVKAITDFDAVRISEQPRDVAFAIYRFGRQFLVNKNLEESIEMAPHLKELFIKKYQTIKSLSAEELELTPLLIKDEFLRKLLFVLKGVYEEGNNAWAHNLPIFLNAFEEIDYFWPNHV